MSTHIFVSGSPLEDLLSNGVKCHVVHPRSCQLLPRFVLSNFLGEHGPHFLPNTPKDLLKDAEECFLKAFLQFAFVKQLQEGCV